MSVVPMLAGVGLLSVCCLSSSFMSGATGGGEETLAAGAGAGAGAGKGDDTKANPTVAELQSQVDKLERDKQTAIAAGVAADVGRVDQTSLDAAYAAGASGNSPSPIICQGSWGVCDTVDGGYLNEGFEFYSVTTPAAHGGGSCPHKDGAKRECDLPCVAVNEDSLVDLHFKGWGWMGTKLDNPYATYRDTGVSRNQMWIDRCNKCRKGGKFPENCNNLSPASYDD